MKIAVLSDIHGNYAAFETCVEYALAQDIHTFFFLGDYVAEFPYPQRTMEMLYDMRQKYECYFIRGNKEDYWLDRRYNPNCVWKNGNHTVGAMEYTYQNITEHDLAFYQELSICMEVHFEGAETLMLCHGSPERNNQKMLMEDAETKRIMEECTCKYILCGHTHGQMTIEHAGKVLWNPGAVGVPKQSGGKTQFMILHQRDTEWEPEFISLEYEKEEILREMQECGLEQRAPYWTQVTRHLLRAGENTHSRALFYAMDLDAAENGSTIWYNVPDKYWIKAITDLLVQKEITLGQSGAHVYELDERRVLKVVFREEVQDDSLWAAYEKEALFYEHCKEKFLPKVYVNIHTDREIFIIMEKYQPLEREQLNADMLQKVMDTLVKIHMLKTPEFLPGEERQPTVFDNDVMMECLSGWQCVLEEHQGAFDTTSLMKIQKSINMWNRCFFDKKVCFNHGDFHFENLLSDVSGNLVVVDWQNCGIGNRAGDISFLLSRLSADGYALEQDEVIKMYCESARMVGLEVEPKVIRQQMCLTNLNTSFRYWHQYLHGSSEERVRDIYEKMVADAKELAGVDEFT